MGPEGRDQLPESSAGPPGRPASQKERTPEDRRNVTRAAFLRPTNLAMLIIGGVFFAITTYWWVIPLTLVTYTLLVLLAARDPLFQRRVLGEADSPSLANRATDTSGIPPERRARWLPRGETRRKVEEALENYRKLVAAIEGSGDVARSVLDDTIPRLHSAAERLVDVAQERERAAKAIQEISPQAAENPNEERNTMLRDLEEAIARSDEEISETRDRLLTLRARMVGVSLNSLAENRAAASELDNSLKELNFRLEALGEIYADSRDDDPPRSD
ncbi:MAG: hypothetical protein WA990_07465 [Rubrobacteraceae bacterium]